MRVVMKEQTGYFQKTCCHNKDLAVQLLHKRFVYPLSTSQLYPTTAPHSHISNYKSQERSMEEGELRSGSSGISHQMDANVFLNEDQCRAIEALLELIMEAVSRMECLEARLACAATGSNVTSSSKNSNAGVNLDGDIMYPPLH
eukprot:CAMPEP_0202027236 /NCGR_PEP_ID=MMETSP0905-20130828/60950_1 /ASSEMBLY_ACC=CAM_ASM_000554 /TAXON_ID=420261 /ORGANISM="Thalassiosira antarctica, Strain CCMP982" /LENGTH=143 /DNA_ID=CAMNT_0048590661 /DNA_START=48 /DNA_END=479 /DNA_ORIENTATION=-